MCFFFTFAQTRQLVRSWYTPQITIKNNPSRNNPTRNEVYIPEPFVAPETEEHFIFTDPWEEFEKNITTSLEPSNNICVTGCSSNNDNVQNYYNDQHCNINSYVDEDQCINDYHSINKCGSFEQPVSEPKYIENVAVHCQNLIEVYTAPILQTQSHYSVCDDRTSSSNNYQCTNTNNCEIERIKVNDEIRIHDQANCDNDTIQNEHSCDIPVNNYSSLHSLKNEILREENGYSESNKEINVDVSSSFIDVVTYTYLLFQ